MKYLYVLMFTVVGLVASSPAIEFAKRKLGINVEELNGPVKSFEKRDVNVVEELSVKTEDGKVETISVKQSCLSAHNKLRELHKDTPDLEYSDVLAQQASDWAEHLAASRTFEHSNDNSGENIYFKMTSYMTFDDSQTHAESPTQAVKSWYSEIDNYDFDTGRSSNGLTTGHFTQVVWKGTRQVGCGVATVKRGTYTYIYIVAQYLPAGNNGRYIQNVMDVKDNAVRPSNAIELEPVTGCLDYGLECSSYKQYCFFFEDHCPCTCA